MRARPGGLAGASTGQDTGRGHGGRRRRDTRAGGLPGLRRPPPPPAAWCRRELRDPVETQPPKRVPGIGSTWLPLEPRRRAGHLSAVRPCVTGATSGWATGPGADRAAGRGGVAGASPQPSPPCGRRETGRPARRGPLGARAAGRPRRRAGERPPTRPGGSMSKWTSRRGSLGPSASACPRRPAGIPPLPARALPCPNGPGAAVHLGRPRRRSRRPSGPRGRGHSAPAPQGARGGGRGRGPPPAGALHVQMDLAPRSIWTLTPRRPEAGRRRRSLRRARRRR